jgi:hypothetical protein
MVFCLPLFTPLLFAQPTASVSTPLLTVFVIYTILVHRPCVQCLLLFSAALCCLGAIPSACPAIVESLSVILPIPLHNG